jgi:hypothetical protein
MYVEYVPGYLEATVDVLQVYLVTFNAKMTSAKDEVLVPVRYYVQ